MFRSPLRACCIVSLILSIVLWGELRSQSVANYAVTRTTGITFTSIMSTGLPCNSWRYNGAFQQDDNRSNPVDIGFDFWYDGARHTEVSISTNGYIDFSASTNNGGPTGGAYGYINNQFSQSNGTLNAIAPFYDDQTTQGGSDPLGNSIRTQLSGSAPNRVFTVEWNDMAVYLNTSPSLTYQVKLYETTGVIEFIYSTMSAGTANFSYTCGLNGPTMNGAPTAAQLKVQQVANTTTFNQTQQNGLSVMPTANSRLRFTPPVPANPGSSLSFTNVQPSSMTLNWTNWATNEVGYAIYSSTDGITWEFEAQTAANATNATITGLFSGTSYQWRVYAVTEGCLSSAVNGTQATLPGTTFISVQSGNWATGATWNTGTVPTASDNVIINNAHTVTINQNAACHNLAVGQGTSGILRFGNNNTSRTLTVSGNVNVNAGAQLTVNLVSNTTHSFVCTGNIGNLGTIDFTPDATSFCNAVFNHMYANQTIGGSGVMTRFNLITVDKGSALTRILDITATNFMVPAGFLDLQNGTFRLSTASAVNITPFNVGGTIPYTARIWMNSATSTMSFTGGNINLFGELRCSSGTMNIGSAANNGVSSNGGLFVVTGGTVNVAGRYDRPNTTCISRFSMTGGTIVLNTVGSTSTTLAPFHMDVQGSQFYHVGGTIIIRREGGTGAQNLGFNCTGGNIGNPLGGTLQIGDASTPVGQTMLINTISPVGNLLVNSANATAQLSVNALSVLGNVTLSSGILLASNLNLNVGGNWVNTAGTYTAGTNTTTFDGAAAQTLSRTSGAENFNNITFSGAGAKTLLQAINCRNLTINAGASFSAGVTGFQIGMIGNWVNNGLFSAGTAGVVLCNGTVAQTIGGSAVTDFRDLTIQNAAGVSITANENLLGTLSLTTGMFTTTGFDFTLVSNVNGTGRIGTITGGDITGDVIQQRYIYTGPTNWRQLAAPVDGQTFQSWNDDLVTSGFPGSDFPTMAFYSIAPYDETVAGPKEYGYSAPTNVTNPINPLRGYYVYVGPLAVTLDVKGVPRKFNQTYSLTYTPSAGPMEDGWNMLSNPYPSAIDWDAAGFTRTNTDQVLYIWNPTLNQYATYVGGVGTNGGSRYIPSSQAFWVRAIAPSPAMSITESVKANQDPSYMHTAPNTIPYLLKLKLSTSNGDDETVIRFNAAGSDTFDVGFDAYKMPSNDTNACYLASTPDSVEAYSINTMGTLTGDRIVPLKVMRRASGTFTISRDSATNMPMSACIILEDLQNGNLTSMGPGGSYTYSHVGGDTSVRFLLHFSPALSKGCVASICPASADGKAFASGIGSGPWDYTWEDANGNQIAQHNAVNGTDTLFGLTPGVYTVTVDGNFGNCAQRSDTIHVEGPPLLFANDSMVQPTCPNDVNGEIYVFNVSGRPGPYSYQWNTGETDSSIIGIGAGQHEVYITDNIGCTDTMTFMVTSISQLNAAFIFPSDTVYYPNPISPLNYSNYSSSWFWDFGDMSGTSTDANPFYFYAASGTYNVMLVSYDSLCSDTAWNTIVLLNNVGIPEITSAADIQLANTQQGADLILHDNITPVVEVQIYSANGQLMYASQEAISDGLIHLNMMSYADGNYIVRVIDDGRIWSGKLFWKQ
jgi:hypothetical protein